MTCSGTGGGCCDQVWSKSVQACWSYKLKTVTEEERKKETGQIQDPAAAGEKGKKYAVFFIFNFPGLFMTKFKMGALL